MDNWTKAGIIIVLAFLLALVGLCVYGAVTQCEGVADNNYEKCS